MLGLKEARKTIEQAGQDVSAGLVVVGLVALVAVALAGLALAVAVYGSRK